MSYSFKEIETKWQKYWAENNSFAAEDSNSKKKKFFALIEFPYPSSNGLHVGHPRSYTAMDVIARKRRFENYNVLFPIGWDAFGLPAENYAIKTGVHPAISTNNNIDNFRRQLKMLGFSFDWDREVNTSEPEYYKWTQWIFIKLFENGLAYKAEIPINWCTSCNVGLSNEEVVNGKCERCHGRVVRKQKKQWMLKITAYADRLIQDLDTVDFLDRIKVQQKNWIGKSYGADVEFELEPVQEKIHVFTTRPDTLFGATYMVMSPEHPLIEKMASKIKNFDEVKKYLKHSAMKSELERTELLEKTGVCLEGILAKNPVNNQRIPVWISDYVLMSYGTGCIMAVPGHDTRDWEFAKKFDLPIVEVVKGGKIEQEAYLDIEEGTMVNSGFLDGLAVKEAKDKIIEWLSERSLGKKSINYKLRDWLFSRQRYWGEPIPIVFCEKCGWVTLPEKELPLKLPELKEYKPAINGESPLASLDTWINTTCPKCNGPATRETDTMPQWAGSSWYFLRYVDPHNNKAFASKENLDYWMPVDWYNGGMEHTTLHLLYSRFWGKFLYDIGVLPTSEPYQKRTSHGMILGADNEKMSKSRGNVVNPDEIVDKYGADTFRVYEMFIGPFDQAAAWNTEGLMGIFRFLNRVLNVGDKVNKKSVLNEDQQRLMHKTIMGVSQKIETMRFNTSISDLMTYTNSLLQMDSIPLELFKVLCILLNPFAPHLTSEMWEKVIGGEKQISEQPWPKFEAKLAQDEHVTMAIQINGKMRDTLAVERGISKETVLNLVKQNEKLNKYIEGKEFRRVIFVPDKILNIVV